jgi:hypothetical protein
VHGVNGVAIDLKGALGTPTLADFEFRVGNGQPVGQWAAAPAPQSLSIRAGAGANGSDRITIVWPDGAIVGKWLQVRVKGFANSGLARDDVFYFGNAIGETGNDSGNALVSSVDVIGARDNPHGPFDQATITDRFDFNRDGLVNGSDVIIARDHTTSPFTALQMILVPGDAAPPAPAAATWVLSASVVDTASLAAWPTRSSQAVRPSVVQLQHISAGSAANDSPPVDRTTATSPVRSPGFVSSGGDAARSGWRPSGRQVFSRPQLDSPRTLPEALLAVDAVMDQVEKSSPEGGRGFTAGETLPSRSAADAAWPAEVDAALALDAEWVSVF